MFHNLWRNAGNISFHGELDDLVVNLSKIYLEINAISCFYPK